LLNTNKLLLEEVAKKNQARKSLLKQHSFLNTLIDTIPIPVFYKDISGRYLGCNQAFEHFSQKPRSEIIGKSVYDMGPIDIAEKYAKKDRELFENPGTQQYEWKFQKNDGEERTVIFQKATFEDQKGEVAGLIGSFFDITERKKMEKQLFQAQKLQAISTLTRGIAHDFNNILSTMMGYTELALIKLSDDSQIRADLDKVYSAGKRAAEMVKQIFAYSRQSDQTIQPVKVGPLIHGVLKLVQASLPATIKTRSSIRTEVTVLADPTRFRQALINLCAYSGQVLMAEGGVLEVTLDATILDSESMHAEAGLSDGPFMKLQIKSSGPGIPQNIFDPIFEPSFSLKDPSDSTDINLSRVHDFIKGLGGIIHVSNKPGEGSIFEILIPLVAGIGEMTSPERGILPHGRESILFVDDTEPLVDLGKMLLEKLDYSVTGCTSSIEALAIFRDNPQKFDLVITDEKMPELTGTMLAAELSQIRPEIPIILCSDSLSFLDKDDDATAKGIKAFIPKPILTETMSKTVRKVLDGIYSDE
jgi:PAS domain S-box-containing protein